MDQCNKSHDLNFDYVVVLLREINCLSQPLLRAEQSIKHECTITKSI